MKSLLVFNLNSWADREEHTHTLNGAKYHMRIEEFGQTLRNLCKYSAEGDLKATEDGMVNVEELRAAYWEIMKGVEE